MTRTRFIAGSAAALGVCLAFAGCGRRDAGADRAVLALDTTDCPPGSNIIEGTDGNDTIVGTNGPDCILGYGGDDSIAGGNGDDFIVGGDGADEIAGGTGADQLFGDDGDDTLAGGNGPDTIDGGDGNDIISGDNGPDDISGGPGNDVILDSRGPATLQPGDGTDSCSGTDCELPAAIRCTSDADCLSGQTCVGGACVYCRADASCDDGATCTGVEECVPTTGCRAGVDLPAGFDLGIVCTAGLGDCERPGPLVCDGAGGVLCTAVPAPPASDDTDCDGADDDCDGVSDEAYVSSVTTCGTGECGRTGLTACAGAVVSDSCVPGMPATEVCNLLDDDCDGATDEGLPDDDGDTLCDANDPCPYHPDPIATAPPDAVIVRGQMLVSSPSQQMGVPADFPDNALSSLTVRTVAFGGVRETLTDCNGNFAYVLPAATTLPAGPQDIAFRFQGDVPGPGGITSEMVVVDDLFDVWGSIATHTGYFRTTPTTIGTDASGRAMLTFDAVTLDTSEAELFRIGVAIIEDFHQAVRGPVPGGRLAYMRRSGVLFELTPYTNYDYVDMTATVLDLDRMDTPRERELVLLHESAHVFRHILDGDRVHFDGDSALFTYLTCHTGRDIFSEGYAFNEGWADYWRRSRRRDLRAAAWTAAPATLPWAPGLPAGPTPRDPQIVADTTLDPWGRPDTVTDYCPGTAGPRNVDLTTAHMDWVEQMVADRIFEIVNTGCAGADADQADATLVSALRANRGLIHSLFDFEVALCAAQPACCGLTRTMPPPLCPPDYHDAGLTCIGPTEHSITHLPR